MLDPQNETKSFVEMLFTVVDTKEYLSPAVKEQVRDSTYLQS